MLADLIRTAVFRVTSRSSELIRSTSLRPEREWISARPNRAIVTGESAWLRLDAAQTVIEIEVGDCNETSMFTGWKWVRNECGNRGIKLNAGESSNPKASFVLNSKWKAHRM